MPGSVGVLWPLQGANRLICIAPLGSNQQRDGKVRARTAAVLPGLQQSPTVPNPQHRRHGATVNATLNNRRCRYDRRRRIQCPIAEDPTLSLGGRLGGAALPYDAPVRIRQHGIFGKRPRRRKRWRVTSGLRRKPPKSVGGGS